MMFKSMPIIEGYEVSNTGIVRSVDRKIQVINNGTLCDRTESAKVLKPNIKKNGYLGYSLSVNKKRLSITAHRLVAIAFIDNPQSLPQVNHIDGNKLNNAISNLEWCTSAENHQHAKKLGISHYSDARNGFAKSVIDTSTGKLFETAKMAYNSIMPTYGYVYFTRMLTGERKNKTHFAYLEK